MRRSNLFVLALVCATATSAFAKNNTTTTVVANPAAVIRGNTAQLVATVVRSGASGVPTGSVTFTSGTVVVGTAPLNGSGVATLTEPTTTLALAVYQIKASYSGDSSDNGSGSPIINVPVQSATTTTFAASPTSIQQGQSAVLTAEVARVGNSGYATGVVTFLYGTETVATANLVNGVAQISVSTGTNPLGGYGLTAHYEGGTLDAASTSSSLTATITPASDVLTFRNDVSRTGVQSAETVLTPANVNANQFGKLYSFTTDGYTFAEQLFAGNYTMNDGQAHNVLFVFNGTGTIYAFDADGNNPTAGYLWKASVVLSGEQVVVPSDYYGCGNPSPYAGIIGTPTIDRARGVIYLIGKTKKTSGGSTTYYQRIHAINMADGTEKLNGPTVVQASFPGKGNGSVNGTIAFDPLSQNERAALVEANGSVWITWASHCDAGNYHGWTIGYNASDVSQQTGVYNNTPNGNQGGIWMVSGGISADNLGNLFTAAGNGSFEASGPDLSDAAQRLVIGSNGLSSGDWFVPYNENSLSGADLDFGTADALLFDDPSSGIAPHLLATADKTGRVYLLNRYDLGGFASGPNGGNGDLQDFAYGNQIFTNFGFFNHRLYVGAGGMPLGAFDYTPGTANTVGFLATSPSMTTPQTFSDSGSFGGIQPVFSANGTSNGIAWGFDTNGRVLYAFDANNLSNQLYSSATNSSRDQPPPPVRFTIPVVANGKVYVAGQGVVAVYGLLP